MFQCPLNTQGARLIESRRRLVTLLWQQNFWISTNHGPANMVEKTKKLYKRMTFLCMIAPRNKMVVHTLFDNASCRLCQESFVEIQKFCYHGNVTSHFSSYSFRQKMSCEQSNTIQMNGGNNREEKSLRHVSMIAKFLDLIKLWSCKYCWKKKEKIDMYHFPVYVALRTETTARTSHFSSLSRYSQRLQRYTFALI